MKSKAKSGWRTGLRIAVGMQLTLSVLSAQTGDDSEQPWSAPPLERVVVVQDGRTGETVEWSELLDELAFADVVFLGEQHTDESTHRVELAVYEGLLERRLGAVVLALEMFERDTQLLLDQYIAGEIDEPTFLEGARPWSNYRTAYRPMVERAKRDGGVVVASNFPVTLRRRLAMEGAEVLETLEGAERGWAPLELFPNTPRYWRWVDNAVRGHIGMMGGPKDPSDPRLTATQSLWDNSMGEACAIALDQNPGSSVLHVNGGFHSSYWEGTTRQLLLRKPDVSVKTVDIVPVSNPALIDTVGEPVADYIVYAARRATDIDSGRYAVSVPRNVRYRIHLPDGASDVAPVPLLIWLGEAGLTASDGIELWKERIGDEVAIIALETPYREISEDLGDGGRWFWPDTFSADISTMISGVEGAWSYVSRNMPVDGTRTVLAGEGTGASVAAAVSMLSGLPIETIAFAPRQYSKIKDFPLPLPEFRGDADPVDKRLVVYAAEADREWWTTELDEYTAIDLDNELREIATNAWYQEYEAENSIRTAAGLSKNGAPSSKGGRVMELSSNTVRARHWARLAALKKSRELGVEVSVLPFGERAEEGEGIAFDLDASSFREGNRLPKCPGDFGGTTVVVLPADTPDDEVEAWVQLTEKESDPLAARSRFLRLRVATATGDLALPNVLEKLLSENRENVLVVPVRFCASGDEMRALARLAREFEDTMTLHWLPGLGGN